MPNRIIFLFVNLLLPTLGLAQYENFWAFGGNAGINFNSSPPEAVRTSLNTREGCASVCSKEGQLLFYTDGTFVWNKDHRVMPNGNDLPGTAVNITSSTSQGTLIVPHPGNSQQYYIFSLGDINTTADSGRLYYSLIDMSLNDGLGDVVDTSKGVLLTKDLTEHLFALPGFDCNIWLITCSRAGNQFKVYNIGLQGIDTQATVSAGIQGIGQYHGVIGYIDVSPDGRKLAIAQGNLVLYDFNRRSGQVNHPVILSANAATYAYGVCFSPDNTKLYATMEHIVHQFDLTTNDSTLIQQSMTRLSSASDHADGMKRGPDGKIYCSGFGNSALQVIQQPNRPGLSCQYEEKGFTLFRGTLASFGLPNTIAVLPSYYNTFTDTVYCLDSFLLKAKVASGQNYTWQDGYSSPERYIKKTGTYWLRYLAADSICGEYVDTFHITMPEPKGIYSTTRIAGMCAADTATMQPVYTRGKNYIWEDGSTKKNRIMNRSGIFWIRYQSDTACAFYVDTFVLSFPEKDYTVAFSVDSFACQQQLLSINNTSDPRYQNFHWSLGDGSFSTLYQPQHIYPKPGSYKIELRGDINDKCSDTYSRIVVVDSLIPVRFQVDRDQICVGESIVLTHQLHSPAVDHLIWHWGDGRSSGGLSSHSIHSAYDKPGLMPITLSVYFRSCPADSFSIPIQVFPLPLVELYSESGLCLKDAPLLLKNKASNPVTTYHYLWNTGATEDHILVREAGQYSLTLSAAPLGCRATGTIEISKDCRIDIPNAFTPNGDGINDYFFPKSMLAAGIQTFKMEIFNRWGQRLFTSSNIFGSGWNGRFNGQEQEHGVYIYIIEIRMANNNPEYYRGNVQLIR